MIKKIFLFLVISLLGVLITLLVFNYRYPFSTPKGGGWSIGYQELVDPFAKWKPEKDNIINFDWLNNQTDVNTKFLADPFVIKEKGNYYIFFEHQAEGNANIGLLISEDGSKYNYAGDVLDEKFHLSFPQIFKHRDEFFMVPETKQAGHILLYKASSFPFKWEISDTLIKNVSFKDPAILVTDSMALLSVSDDNLTQYIYTADSLTGKWKLDDRFKIRKGDETRVGGNFFQFNNTWYIPFQNNKNGYGSGISIYQIHLEEKLIRFEKKQHNYLTGMNSIKWFNKGMHHLAIIEDEDGYYTVFDGDLVDTSLGKQESWKASFKYNFYDLKNWVLNIFYK